MKTYLKNLWLKLRGVSLHVKDERVEIKGYIQSLTHNEVLVWGEVKPLSKNDNYMFQGSKQRSVKIEGPNVEVIGYQQILINGKQYV